MAQIKSGYRAVLAIGLTGAFCGGTAVGFHFVASRPSVQTSASKFESFFPLSLAHWGERTFCSHNLLAKCAMWLKWFHL